MDPQAIAHYRIVSKLGEGGMGAVYRATDTKLARDVAIKVLPEAFAKDPDRMARFVREAQMLAALNHPNIATIHGIEENAIVMELVEGPTLGDRIAQGAVPMEEALAIARQIAEALETAHEKGIIHRDLKPANIKVTADGKVKVLDFGLAKLADPTEAGEDPASAPTVVRGQSPTMAGMIMGTAGYMAPEQARGLRVDKRADIWAFGVVLFEMLTGRELFGGETVSDAMAAVLRAEFDWGSLPERTPAAIRRLLRRSLERDRKKRLADIADARIEIDEALGAGEDGGAAVVVAPQRTGRLPWVVAAAVLGVALVFSLVAWRRASTPVAQPLMRLRVDMGAESVLGGTGNSSPRVILSPDGTRLIHTVKGADGKNRLAARSLDQAQAVVLSGTEDATGPFFSPDGQWVGFFADGKLKKAMVQGGGAVTLCDARALRGASWGDDGNIVAALGVTSGLSRVSSAGGAPQELVPLETRDRTYRYPQVLPGSKAVLFVAGTQAGDYETARIDVYSFETGKRKTLQSGAYFGRYVPSGHLLFMRQGALLAAPLDLARLELAGAAVPVLENVTSYPGSGTAEFTFSQTGAAVYQTGKSMEAGWTIHWLESSGKARPLQAKPGRYWDLRFSPDGKRLALSSDSTSPKPDVWVYEWERDTMTRLTFVAGANTRPVWSPDGRHIVFRSEKGAISWMRSDGAGDPVLLVEGKNRANTDTSAHSFSPDGKRLAITMQDGGNNYDIWTLPLEGSETDHPKVGQPEPFLRTPFTEAYPAFSPDGRWIAYASNESGSIEVYVRAFPGPGGKWQVSTGGGIMPVWSRNGRELFYRGAEQRIWVAPYTVKGDSFGAGKPQVWAETRVRFFGASSQFDLAPDGKSFAAVLDRENEAEQRPTHVTFLLNFFDELRRKAPVGK